MAATAAMAINLEPVGHIRQNAPLAGNVMSTTILIVDDDKKMRDMLRFYLEEDDYRILEAGQQARGALCCPVRKARLDFARPDDAGDGRYRIYAASIGARPTRPSLC